MKAGLKAEFKVRRYIFLFVLVHVMAIVGCATPVVPVAERDTLSTQEEIEQMGGNLIRIVQQDDTLYSLAFEAGVDFRELAQWNKISSPYTISIGQKIRLTEPTNFVAMPTTSASVGNNSTTPVVTPRTVGRASNSSAQRPSTASSIQTSSSGEGAPSSWLWPVNGMVVGSYNLPAGRKGIDIAGTEGTPIKATASGRVVYSGTGLRGYGEMLILKHSDDYFSAYAHNRRILVKEGDSVTQGQAIAELGSSGTDKSMLHFQIRRQGQPVDPRQYLPGQG